MARGVDAGGRPRWPRRVSGEAAALRLEWEGGDGWTWPADDLSLRPVDPDGRTSALQAASWPAAGPVSPGNRSA